MSRNTFATDLEAAAGDESIETVVIGGRGFSWHEDDDAQVPASKKGIVLSWAEARPLLDYSYDTGYGGADCHAVYAYTATLIIWIHEYDGSTHPCSAPRNPGPCKPELC